MFSKSKSTTELLRRKMTETMTGATNLFGNVMRFSLDSVTRRASEPVLHHTSVESKHEEMVNKIVELYCSPNAIKARDEDQPEISLDLDETIVFYDDNTFYDEAFFSNNGLVLDLNHPDYKLPHLIYPGVPELILALMERNYKITIFSTRTDEHVRVVKEHLFKHVLITDSNYKRVEGFFKIFSYQNLQEIDTQTENDFKRTHDFKHISKLSDVNKNKVLKKDLAVVGNLVNKTVIHLDDLTTMIHPEQAKNVLKVTGGNLKDSNNIYTRNQIFLATGLLRTILNAPKPLEELYNRQYEDIPSGKKPRFEKLRNEFDWYEAGRKFLAGYNKKKTLEFAGDIESEIKRNSVGREALEEFSFGRRFN